MPGIILYFGFKEDARMPVFKLQDAPGCFNFIKGKDYD